MNRVSDILVSLAGCLEAQIEEDGSPRPCFVGIHPGENVAQEFGGDCNERCGMAWVRLVTTYPAVAPGVVSEQVDNCNKGIGFDIEVGITRCIPVEPLPSEEEVLAASLLQSDDMLTMLRAIQCCPSLPNRDIILGSYTPMGPLGGMVGGRWVVMAMV